MAGSLAHVTQSCTFFASDFVGRGLAGCVPLLRLSRFPEMSLPIGIAPTSASQSFHEMRHRGLAHADNCALRRATDLAVALFSAIDAAVPAIRSNRAKVGALSWTVRVSTIFGT